MPWFSTTRGLWIRFELFASRQKDSASGVLQDGSATAGTGAGVRGVSWFSTTTGLNVVPAKLYLAKHAACGGCRTAVLPREPGLEREAVSWFSNIYPRMRRPGWPVARPLNIIQVCC